jgi:hypothetical protein
MEVEDSYETLVTTYKSTRLNKLTVIMVPFDFRQEVKSLAYRLSP